MLLNSLGLAGCGAVKTGSVAYNDPIPTGNVVGQGSFTSQNGKTVTGTAAIYQSTDGATYTLHLGGISAPSETGLQLRIQADNQDLSALSLRASSGSQNYSLSVSGASPVFRQVTLYSTLKATEYGTAVLTR